MRDSILMLQFLLFAAYLNVKYPAVAVPILLKKDCLQIGSVIYYF